MASQDEDRITSQRLAGLCGIELMSDEDALRYGSPLHGCALWAWDPDFNDAPMIWDPLCIHEHANMVVKGIEYIGAAGQHDFCQELVPPMAGEAPWRECWAFLTAEPRAKCLAAIKIMDKYHLP